MNTLRQLIAAIAVAAACIASPRHAHAQDAPMPRVDTDVETVVTGGQWTVGGMDGQYRVIVVQTGWEEVRHLVVVQWLRADADRHDVVVQASVGPSTLGVNAYSLYDPRLVRRNGGWYLLARATPEPMAAPREVSFRLGGPGHVTPVAAVARR